jgi:hypothetical protein
MMEGIEADRAIRRRRMASSRKRVPPTPLTLELASANLWEA